MGKTFRNGEGKKAYYDRLEEHDRTGSWPKRKSALSGAQDANKAHRTSHPEEQKPAAAPQPTLFDVPQKENNPWDR